MSSAAAGARGLRRPLALLVLLCLHGLARRSSNARIVVLTSALMFPLFQLFVNRRFYDDNSSLTPKELFAKVCSPGEDIDSLDTESWLSLDAASEPSVEPKSEQDGVVGAGLVAGPCNVDIAA